MIYASAATGTWVVTPPSRRRSPRRSPPTTTTKGRWSSAPAIPGSDRSGSSGRTDAASSSSSRAEVLRDKPRACFIQIVAARHLLGQAAEPGTRVALVSDDGRTDGDAPASTIAAARAASGPEPVTAAAEGSTWLAQLYPLFGPGQERRIGGVVVTQDLGVALAAMIDPAVVPLAAIALGLIAVGLLAAAALAGRFTGPIIALERAAQRVAGGDLQTRVGGRFGGDEIQRLGHAFDHMVEGLEERERVKRTFKKYLAPDVVDYLLAHPQAQELGGARRELTIMFSDLVRFTGFAESRAPEEVVAVLNRYFTRVSERIAARGGTVDKYIGDAVMAFFGAPVPRADHAAGACLAALDHLAAVDELGRAGDFPALDVRIGINTGDVILGNIGLGGAQDYTVIGDTVNLAQRLEGANRELGTRLLVSEAVVKQAAGAIETQDIDRLVVPGRATAVSVYEVVGTPGFLAANPMKFKAFEAYAQGLAALRARRFGAAEEGFRAALADAPDDRPSALQLARAKALGADPPSADDWDGALRMTSK